MGSILTMNFSRKGKFTSTIVNLIGRLRQPKFKMKRVLSFSVTEKKVKTVKKVEKVKKVKKNQSLR